MLNVKFTENMKALLGEEYSAYVAELEHGAPRKALRVNALKITREEFMKLFPFSLTPTPYAENGFVLTDKPYPYGTHAYHHAGLFYMQEPSAMSTVSLLLPYLAEKKHPLRLLDLCAAPGGKSTQLASFLLPEDALFGNDADRQRAGILAGNLERMGVRNAVVTCNYPETYAELYPDFFDAVVVDAPCSGEGMFRREDAAVRDWSGKSVESCAQRQLSILNSAAKTVAAGGYLVYSTCTLNAEENEGVVEAFLTRNTKFASLPPRSLAGCTSPGFPPVTHALRVFPHRHPGEGHFACLLQNTGENCGGTADFAPRLTKPDASEIADFSALWSSLTHTPPFGTLKKLNNRLYLCPADLPLSSRLCLVSPGVCVGEYRGGRLVPQHSLALSLRRGDAKKAVSFASSDVRITKYLHGETIDFAPDFTGWGVLEADGYPLGLIKAVDGLLKNHYPKGLRNRK